MMVCLLKIGSTTACFALMVLLSRSLLTTIRMSTAGHRLFDRERKCRLDGANVELERSVPIITHSSNVKILCERAPVSVCMCVLLLCAR
jgi:hypothetical protein